MCFACIFLLERNCILMDVTDHVHNRSFLHLYSIKDNWIYKHVPHQEHFVHLTGFFHLWLWLCGYACVPRYCPFSLESPPTFSSCFSLIIQSFYVLITS